MYYEIWQQFDPEGTQYIRYDQLPDFLDVLEPPLQIHKPNKYKIVSMDIPLCRGDLIYCVDILDALTRDFFARKGNPIEEPLEIDEAAVAIERPGYDPVSSTLWRQREENCARLIQHAWKRHLTKGPKSDNDGEEGSQGHQSSSPGPSSPQQETAVLVDSDGYAIKNGHKVLVVTHSRSSSSISSRSTDVWMMMLGISSTSTTFYIPFSVRLLSFSFSFSTETKKQNRKSFIRHNNKNNPKAQRFSPLKIIFHAQYHTLSNFIKLFINYNNICWFNFHPPFSRGPSAAPRRAVCIHLW